MAVEEGDILKVLWKAKHTDPNTQIRQAFFFKVATLVDADNLQVGEELDSAITALYQLIAIRMSNRYEKTAVKVTNQSKKELIKDNLTLAFSGTGGIFEALPAQDCPLVIVRSNKLGHQARKFLGPVLEDTVLNGALTPAALVDFQAFGTEWEKQLNGALTTNVYSPVTVKFGVGGQVLSTEFILTGLSQAFSDMRTQRSRRPGVGLS